MKRNLWIEIGVFCCDRFTILIAESVKSAIGKHFIFKVLFESFWHSLLPSLHFHHFSYFFSSRCFRKQLVRLCSLHPVSGICEFSSEFEHKMLLLINNKFLPLELELDVLDIFHLLPFRLCAVTLRREGNSPKFLINLWPVIWKASRVHLLLFGCHRSPLVRHSTTQFLPPAIVINCAYIFTVSFGSVLDFSFSKRDPEREAYNTSFVHPSGKMRLESSVREGKKVLIFTTKRKNFSREITLSRPRIDLQFITRLSTHCQRGPNKRRTIYVTILPGV